VKVYDEEALAKYSIDTDMLHLLVHSGSRSLGAQYLSDFVQKAQEKEQNSLHGHYGVDTSTDLFKEYIANHDKALNFAVRNRQLIARRMLHQVSEKDAESPNCLMDIHHNFMEKIDFKHVDSLLRARAGPDGKFPKEVPDKEEDSKSQVGWLHRKGATPTTHSPILVIPGSRGTLSYLVEVNPDVDYISGHSLAHGAGRKMMRSKAKSMFHN